MTRKDPDELPDWRIEDFPAEEEAWPDLEDELVPDLDELPTSGPYGPAFTYLHAARVTLDSGLIRPTKLMAMVAAKLTLQTAREQDDLDDEAEAAQLRSIAGWEVDVEDPVELLEVLSTISAFVERRLSLPSQPGQGSGPSPPGRQDLDEL